MPMERSTFLDNDICTCTPTPTSGRARAHPQARRALVIQPAGPGTTPGIYRDSPMKGESPVDTSRVDLRPDPVSANRIQLNLIE